MSKTSPRTPRTQTELRAIIEEHLTLARDDYTQAAGDRIKYAHLARRLGMTYDAIGQHLGLTGVGVRAMLRRNPEPRND